VININEIVQKKYDELIEKLTMTILETKENFKDN